MRTTGRLLGVVALALMLASCDKCGSWFGFQASSILDTCKNTVPPQ